MASTSEKSSRCCYGILIRSRRIQELVPAQPVEEEPQERVRTTPLTDPIRARAVYNDPSASPANYRDGALRLMLWSCSIKKPKTHRYPSLKGTDPKFRRNHRHALHGTMRALVRIHDTLSLRRTQWLTPMQKEVKEGKRDAA